MAIVKKSLRNGRTQITSSYFEDVIMLRRMAGDPEFKDLRWDSRSRDYYRSVAPRIKLESAIAAIKAWRLGCQEVREYVNSLKPEQIENYETKYLGEDYMSYEELQAAVKDESLSEKERADCQQKIDSIDKFCKMQFELEAKAKAEGRDLELERFSHYYRK